MTGINNERSRGNHASMSNGFVSGGSAWNSRLWRTTDDPLTDTSLEAKAGSSSLLSSSESDGFTTHRNVPWNTISTSSAGFPRSQNNSFTAPRVQQRSNGHTSGLSDTTDSQYFTMPRSSGIPSSAGMNSHNAYLHSASASEGVSPAGDGLSFAGLQAFGNGEGRRQPSSSAFATSPVGTGFPIQKSPFTSPLETTGPEDTMPFSQVLPDTVQHPLGRNAYSHAPHNSASYASHRPVQHYSYPSFHSESQGVDAGYGNGSVDLETSLNGLQLNDVGLSGSNAYGRAFPSNASYDNAFHRLKFQHASDPPNFPAAAGYETSANFSVPYQPVRSRLGAESAFPPSYYGRVDNVYAGFEDGSMPGGHFRNASGSRIPGHHQKVVERRMRTPVDPEFVHPQSQLPAKYFQASYDLMPFEAAHAAHAVHVNQVNAMACYPPLNHMKVMPRHHDLETKRSKILEEVRSRKHAWDKEKEKNQKLGRDEYFDFALKDIRGHVVEFSGDQHGSRFIQNRLKDATSDEKDMVFDEIYINCLQLMSDVFGNYVIQKLFEFGNQYHKKSMAKVMKGHVQHLSMQMYGCRVVQKALEVILTEQQAELVHELEPVVLKCVRDQNGNHVIQKAIERVPNDHSQFIVNEFLGKIEEHSTHPYGCRIVQRILEHARPQNRLSILAEIQACNTKLITDQFGNYVIQHVIENGDEENRSTIIDRVIEDVLNYSRHKFASNVVEKCILCGTEEQRRRIFSLILGKDDQGRDSLFALMRDQFGNYVIQKVITWMQEHEQWQDLENLKARIRPLLREMKEKMHGKQIAALEKLVPPLSSTESVTSANGTVSSTTPPNSHKSSPQPTKRSVADHCRAPVVGAAPPTPPPTDPQSNQESSTETGGIAKSAVTRLAECETADATPNGSVEVTGTT